MNKENKHNKDLGFQVPQDFFKNFEEEMITQLSLDKKIGKETGFQTPDGYFESLEEQLMPSSKSKVINFNPSNSSSSVKLLYPLLAVAAILAVILALNTRGNEILDIASIETTELEDYLAEDAFLYDDTAVDILFTDNDVLDQINFSEGIEPDDLYDYLEDEIELNEIIIE